MTDRDPLERIFRRRTDESDLVFLIDDTRKRLARRRRAYKAKRFIQDAFALVAVLVFAVTVVLTIWAVSAPH